MELLSTNEQILLLAVLALGDDAYGVAVRDHIEATAGHTMSVGATYTSLERLVATGMLDTRVGDPTPERGGRAKRYYSLTALGATALEDTRRATARMWEATTPNPHATPMTGAVT